MLIQQHNSLPKNWRVCLVLVQSNLQDTFVQCPCQDADLCRHHKHMRPQFRDIGDSVSIEIRPVADPEEGGRGHLLDRYGHRGETRNGIRLEKRPAFEEVRGKVDVEDILRKGCGSGPGGDEGPTRPEDSRGRIRSGKDRDPEAKSERNEGTFPYHHYIKSSAS